jgi:hypothetical protein
VKRSGIRNLTKGYMNKAEKFVSDLCTESFFNLWSYANPRRPSSHKELCDILVVCKTSIIIISVKEINVQKKGNYEVDAERWFRKAVDESVKQIYGAERQLLSMKNVIRSTGEPGIAFAAKSERKIFRIAIALGGEDKYPYIAGGDFGKGFVHIFDEKTFFILLRELDTITDFIHYLQDKENLLESNVRIDVAGEENLLALYLQNGHNFNFTSDSKVYIDNTLWERYVQKEDYLSYHKAREVSYLWDKLIKIVIDDFFASQLETSGTLSDVELALRTMALEDRVSRIDHSRHLLKFLEESSKVRSRILQSGSGITYVLLAAPHETKRDHRRTELVGRCFIARGIVRDQPEVVGIGTEKLDLSKGSSLDIVYLRRDILDSRDLKKMRELQEKTGWFRELKIEPIDDCRASS